MTKTCSKCKTDKPAECFCFVPAEKICPKCKTLKPQKDFLPKVLPSGRPGLRSWCKVCEYLDYKSWVPSPEYKAKASLISKAKYAANPEPKKARAKKFVKDNPEKVKATLHNYYLANKEELLASNKKRGQKNRERYAEAKKIGARRHYANSPQARIVSALRTRLRGALYGTAKAGPTLELLGCPPVWLEAWLESLFKPGMTLANYGKVWHIDHIKPCAAFDLSNPEQQRICFHWTNLQPLFVRENLSKGDKYEV